jgi:cation diffusion facilitator CzcD-associated flavoprotein CzcO
MTSKGNITIAIVGGGLGGVTTAIALGRIGYNGSILCTFYYHQD